MWKGETIQIHYQFLTIVMSLMLGTDPADTEGSMDSQKVWEYMLTLKANQ